MPGKILFKPTLKKWKMKNLEIGTKYVASPVFYSRISREEIVDASVRNSNVPRAWVEMVYDALIQEMINFVMNGHSITIPQLGTIGCRIHSKGVAQAQQCTADTIKRVKFNFRASPRMRRDAQKVSLEKFVQPLNKKS